MRPHIAAVHGVEEASKAVLMTDFVGDDPDRAAMGRSDFSGWLDPQKGQPVSRFLTVSMSVIAGHHLLKLLHCLVTGIRLTDNAVLCCMHGD